MSDGILNGLGKMVTEFVFFISFENGILSLLTPKSVAMYASPSFGLNFRSLILLDNRFELDVLIHLTEGQYS